VPQITQSCNEKETASHGVVFDETHVPVPLRRERRTGTLGGAGSD